MSELEAGPRRATVDRITFEVAGGVAVDAIHARPEGDAARGVIVHPDMGGIRPLFDDLCRRLATHGLAVCAPEPWARVPEAERAELDVSARMERMRDRDDSAQLADLTRAADHLRGADGVDAVAILGFCMGGMYTLKAAATGAFDRAVVFYGMIRLPPEWRGPRQAEPLDTVAGACPTLAIFGDADPWTPVADVDALRAAWAGHPEHEIVVYPGADHGFVHDPSRPAHRPDDAADAWRRALTFLGVT
jgi:carboxymethylenebutenolidase